MLKINPNPQFTAEVPLSEPGKKKPTIVKMTFKYKNRKELIEFGERTKDKPVEEALEEILVGWEGIDAEFNQENMVMLVQNYLPAGLEILRAYHEELIVSRTKN